MFASGWGNPVELDDIGLLGISVPALTAVGPFNVLLFAVRGSDFPFAAGTICQLFYALRIWELNRNKWFAGIIATVSSSYTYCMTCGL